MSLKELSDVLDMVHNVNSTATMPSEFEFDNKEYNTWLDRYVLRWV